MYRWIIASLVLTCAVGCNQHLKWTYPLNPDALYRANAKSQPATVAVFPFKEKRPARNQTATIHLYAVPGLPFGWNTLERPEAAIGSGAVKDIGFDAEEDIGKAAAASMEASGLFERVYFTQGGDTREAHFILDGTVRRTTYRAKIWSYGLGVFAPIVWVLGVPAATVDYDTQLEMSLRDRQGVEYWTYQASASESGITGAYYGVNGGTLPMMVATEAAMNDAFRDLGRKLPNVVARYRQHHEPRRATQPSPAAAPPARHR